MPHSTFHFRISRHQARHVIDSIMVLQHRSANHSTLTRKIQSIKQGVYEGALIRYEKRLPDGRYELEFQYRVFVKMPTGKDGYVEYTGTEQQFLEGDIGALSTLEYTERIAGSFNKFGPVF